MRKILFTVLLLIGVSAQAGLFGSDEVPKELMSSYVAVMMGMNNLQPLGFTVQQFTDTYKADKTKWQKEGAGWIFHIDRADKMTGQKTEIAIMFQQVNGGKAMIPKWVIDKDYLPESIITGMLYRTRTDMIAAGMIKDEPAKLAKPRKHARSGK
jgi:hypothetical protein